MDVFDLVAKIRLDSSEYEQGVGKAKGTFSTLASGVGKAVGTVAKVGATAVAAAATGIAALTKMGVEGYAQYEQLVGGVETLFKDSQGTVMKYAESAYKTAGMSANQYMETVTSFSASLIQSLDGDTAKAAEIGNMAITDMSDNANKMGTSIEMIQNAYNGFAKGNFTMLDNLKLGYGGTKTEMERLLADAEKISGIKYDISSFADVTEAIHVMQEEMGIAGTTAREAASTIEGSISMMKGAWQNLVVGMADENANMEVLINNFVESVATAAHNILPRIEQALKGIGELITALAPVIAEALPRLVANVLPSLLSAAVSLVKALVEGIITALPALHTALLEGVQIILVEVFGVSEQKAGEFADGVNSFFGSVKDGFSNMVTAAQTDGTLLNQVWEGLKEKFELVKNVLSIAFDAVKNAFKMASEQINTDGTWLNETWTGIQEAVQALVDYWDAAFDAAVALFKWVVKQIKTEGTVLNSIWEGIKNFTSTIWESIKNVISNAIEIIKNVFKLFTAILKGDWSAAWDAIKNILSATWDSIKNVVSTTLDVIKNIIDTVWNVIKSITSAIWDSIKTAISNAWENIKTGVSNAINNVKTTISNVFNSVKTTISNIWDGIKSTISGAIDNVKSKISSGMEAAKSTVSSVLDNIKSKFSSIFEGAKQIVTNAIKGVFNFSWSLPELKLPHISVTGGVAPYGIGGKGSLPSFSISWYRKAYDNAMVLSSPTIFGYSAASGNLLGGGDGNGNEVIAGESYLMGLIGSVVASQTAAQNEPIVLALADILEAINGGNKELARALRAGHTIELNGREFGRAVRSYA